MSSWLETFGIPALAFIATVVGLWKNDERREAKFGKETPYSRSWPLSRRIRWSIAHSGVWVPIGMFSLGLGIMALLLYFEYRGRFVAYPLLVAIGASMAVSIYRHR